MTRRQRPGAGSRPEPALDLFAGAEEREPHTSASAARPLAPAAPLAPLTPPPPRERSTPSRNEVPGSSAATAVAISTLTATARDVLEGAFMPLWVRGEVSDFKAHRNGHWYFCLRDRTAQIRCVVWSRDQRGIPASPDDGMQVTALGQVTVYTARGDLQLVVRSMEAEGDGLWRKALERARRALDADGLLAPERKRPIPRFPRRVAVVTSPSGAALHDIVSVARRRWPAVELVVVPTRVQGEGAPEELCAALDRVARWRDADVLIVGRGGGGREDLWAFNDERVARAVANCPIPTISAVGHEVDVTLCDLVADLRAATPSAAAEAAVPSRAEIERRMERLGIHMRRCMQERIEYAADARTRLARTLVRSASGLVERRGARARELAARLHALSPLATIARGYAVARGADGRPLSSAALFAPGEEFSLLLRDGSVQATTRDVQLEPRRAEER